MRERLTDMSGLCWVPGLRRSKVKAIIGSIFTGVCRDSTVELVERAHLELLVEAGDWPQEAALHPTHNTGSPLVIQSHSRKVDHQPLQ